MDVSARLGGVVRACIHKKLNMNILRRLAVIDCGTNTFNLRIVDVGASGGWIPVFGQRIAVKLGQLRHRYSGSWLYGKNGFPSHSFICSDFCLKLDYLHAYNLPSCK